MTTVQHVQYVATSTWLTGGGQGAREINSREL